MGGKLVRDAQGVGTSGTVEGECWREREIEREVFVTLCVCVCACVHDVSEFTCTCVCIKFYVIQCHVQILQVCNTSWKYQLLWNGIFFSIILCLYVPSYRREMKLA